MLVAAGLESKTPAEIADAYEAGFHEDEALVNILPAHVFPRATEHVADMLELAVRLESPGHAYLSEGQPLLRGRRRSPTTGGSRATRSTSAGRPPRRRRARQARQRRLRPVEGRRRGPDPALAEPAGATGSRAGTSSARRWPCATSGPVRDPHRRHRQRVPAPRGRDRAVDARHGRRRRSASGSTASTSWWRAEDGQVDRQLRAGHRARDQGIDPLAFRYLALTVRYGASSTTPTTRSIAAAARRSRRSASHLAALGPPPADGPWAAPVPLRAGSAGPRPIGIATGIAGHQAGAGAAATPAARSSTARPRPPAAPLSPAGRALHDRFVAAIDDDLDLPTALAVVREIAPRRAPRATSGGGSCSTPTCPRPRPRSCLRADGCADGRPARRSRRRCSPRGASRPGARDWARADALRDELAAMGVDVTDGPAGHDLAAAARRSTDAAPYRPPSSRSRRVANRLSTR